MTTDPVRCAEAEVPSDAGEQPLVSVVTPVYNMEKYLPECIESVLRQTYSNWEYVVSDNRSTDRSVEIAREYATGDPRIRVVTHDEHVGVLQNWNRSIRELSHESAYYKVVHADDWLFPECLEKMVDLAEANPSVGIVGSYRLEEDHVTLDGLSPTLTVIPGRELARSTLIGGPYPYLFGAPTATLLRADLVRARDPFYDEAHLQSDTGACYDLLRESDFGVVHQVLTFTRRHNETVTSAVRRQGTKLPGLIWLHLEYGPVFLTPAEYERRLTVRLISYMSFLARSAHRLRDPEFRAYHADFLELLAKKVEGEQVRRGLGHQARRMLARWNSRLATAHD